jgi:hypothetical protein
MQLRHTFGVRSITWLGLETTSGMEYPRFRKTLKDTTSRQNGRAEARFWIWNRALPDWTATSVREVVGAVYDRAFSCRREDVRMLVKFARLPY